VPPVLERNDLCSSADQCGFDREYSSEIIPRDEKSGPTDTSVSIALSSEAFGKTHSTRNGLCSYQVTNDGPGNSRETQRPSRHVNAKAQSQSQHESDWTGRPV
jgi:hypothetical protein